MKWNNHSSLDGLHAFLGASKYHWIHDSDDKLLNRYQNYIATQRGTELHEFAKQCIKLRQRLPKSQKTLNMYVNDAIGFRMIPEQVLLYSENCFGTADAICYDDKKRFLRIHDLKTGVTPAHMEQLWVYTALFYLEYKQRLGFKSLADFDAELRIYQNDGIIFYNPTASDIGPIVDRIISGDKLIKKINEQEGLV